MQQGQRVGVLLHALRRLLLLLLCQSRQLLCQSRQLLWQPRLGLGRTLLLLLAQLQEALHEVQTCRACEPS